MLIVTAIRQAEAPFNKGLLIIVLHFQHIVSRAARSESLCLAVACQRG